MKTSNLFRILSLSLILSLFFSIFISCDEKKLEKEDEAIVKTLKIKAPKYVFFFIGDGMATAQVNLTEAAMFDKDFGLKSGAVGKVDMSISKFPIIGMATTTAADRYITGSAAAATALATGHKTNIGVISKNADCSSNLKTMAEMAKEKGLKVGIVSSVSIDHATPACFYAHQNTRGEYYGIASQMASSKFDYFGGGYAKGNFKSKGAGDIIEKMEAAGYVIADSKEKFNNLKSEEKVWAYTKPVDSSAAMVYEIDRRVGELSLADYTQKGIDLLYNEKGFFMMVEAGKVDWACHANDAVSSTYDMIAFDKAISKAVEFYKQHKEETLIIVTGDHECGGLTLGYASTGYDTAFELLKNQKVSYEVLAAKLSEWRANSVSFEQAMLYVKENFGLGNSVLPLSEYETNKLKDAYKIAISKKSTHSDEENKILFGGYNPFSVTVTHVLNNKAGLDWTSFKHTGVPVPVFALGQAQENFVGYYDNTDIAKKIMRVAEYNK